MTKRIILIISAVIVLIFAVLFIQAALKPKPYSWIQTYSSYQKQPYAASIFFRELKNIFTGKIVKRFGSDDFTDYYWYVEEDLVGAQISGEHFAESEFSSDSALWLDDDGNLMLDTIAFPDLEEDIATENSQDSEEEIRLDTTLNLYDIGYDSSFQKDFNVVMIADYFWCDELNTRAMLLHAFQGNDVLIAANDFNEILMAFLGISIAEDTIPVDDELEYTDHFVVSVHDQLPVQLKSYHQYTHITAYPDSAHIIATNKLDQVLGIKVKVGKGSITLFSLPILFSNYYMLKDDNSVAEHLLLNLPNKDTYWGNRIIGRQQFEDKKSLLSFIHSQESLTWAFYTIVFAVLFLLLFQMKRRQRIIPLLSKPENESLKFLEVISNLYLLNKNNKALLRKKMTYFLEMIRSKYLLDTSVFDEAFFNQLATKSNVDIRIILKIFRDYEILANQKDLHNTEFLHFNKLIQHFKHIK